MFTRQNTVTTDDSQLRLRKTNRPPVVGHVGHVYSWKGEIKIEPWKVNCLTEASNEENFAPQQNISIHCKGEPLNQNLVVLVSVIETESRAFYFCVNQMTS